MVGLASGKRTAPVPDRNSNAEPRWAERGWESWWGAFADRVFAYVGRRVAQDDVPDVVAETFVVAWRRAEEVPIDALPWLYAVARNVIANHQRAERRRASLAAKLGGLRPGPATTTDLDVVESADTVRSARAFLPRAQREVLMLAVWEDLAPARAAVVLGCSVGAYTLRLHRARKRLRDLLDSGQLAAVDHRPRDEGNP